MASLLMLGAVSVLFTEIMAQKYGIGINFMPEQKTKQTCERERPNCIKPSRKSSLLSGQQEAKRHSAAVNRLQGTRALLLT